MKPRVLLTGASGFVGSAILAELIARGYEVSVLSRRMIEAPASVRQIIAGDFRDLDPALAREAIRAHDAVIHAAGHAHAEDGADGDLHRQINRDASIMLAQAAADVGALFVFLSSIKAQVGANSAEIVRAADDPRPDDAYGIAKLAAENTIRALLPGRHTIIRPVLVCGAGAKGNLAALMRLAALPLPLPFGSAFGRRSLISAEDVAVIAVDAIEDPRLTGRTLIAADPHPLSVGEIVTSLRRGMGRSAMVFPVPPMLLAAALRLIGKERVSARLFSPLMAEPTTLLACGWAPRVSASQALERMARHFRSKQ